MSEPQDDFTALMARVLAGSADAARELTEQYGPYLLRVIRRRLDPRLRSKFDSLDFVQDVWASFFGDLPRDGAFCKPADLGGFLAQVASKKVLAAARQRLGYQKYNIGREEPLENAAEGSELAASQPTPSEVAMGREEWARLLAEQPPVYRRILILLHDGKAPVAAAEELGVSVKTVLRVVNRVAPWLIR